MVWSCEKGGGAWRAKVLGGYGSAGKKKIWKTEENLERYRIRIKCSSLTFCHNSLLVLFHN